MPYTRRHPGVTLAIYCPSIPLALHDVINRPVPARRVDDLTPPAVARLDPHRPPFLRQQPAHLVLDEPRRPSRQLVDFMLHRLSLGDDTSGKTKGVVESGHAASLRCLIARSSGVRNSSGTLLPG